MLIDPSLQMTTPVHPTSKFYDHGLLRQWHDSGHDQSAERAGHVLLRRCQFLNRFFNTHNFMPDLAMRMNRRWRVANRRFAA